jgi:UDP-glucose 4-epimerase
VKALVTGAAGFIGSNLSTALTDLGVEVIGLDSFTDYYPRPMKERNVEPLRGRRNFRLVEAALQSADLPVLLDGVTHVYHLAAQAGVRKSWGRDFGTYTSNNIDATQRLLEAVKDHPLTRLVYASSSSVYGDAVSLPMREDAVPLPVSPYGVTKLAAEHLCGLYHTNYGVPTVSLRFFTVYGPGQRPDMGFHRFLRAAHLGEPIVVYGDGEQTRDFTFVGDVVAAILAAGDHGPPGGVYNIGGGSRVSINHVLASIETLIGRPLLLRRESPQKGDMRDTFADTARARTELGVVPSKSLESGLAAESEWLVRLLAIRTPE